LALHHPHVDEYQGDLGFDLNPGPDTVLHAGDVLIVVGNAVQLAQVHEALES